jgi:glycosyltransferase involved in cell wall biosynthesis
MKIAHFNTRDFGGAGRAALRLNKALNLIGEDSCLFVKNKSSDNDKVIQINSPEINNKLFDDLAIKYFYKNIKPGNTISSIMYPSIGFKYLDILQYFDIVNLHWISSFISIEAIMKIRSMGKPVIWTLHDQNPFTGGCHYSNGCEKYKNECHECPQLVNNEFNITKDILAAKIANLPKDITIVTPSKWMAYCARESALFKEYRIEVIPNSVEMDIFKPYNKYISKAELGLEEDTKVIIFGALELDEKRKGLKYLIDSIKYLKTNRYIQRLILENKLFILTFGKESPMLDQIGIPYKALGFIDDDITLAKAYSAADVLAVPSLEDNLPNLILESLSCGTPVVAFNVGGIKDAIIDGKTGFMAKPEDYVSLSECIIKALNKGSMGEQCRKFVEDNFDLHIQGNRYRELYKDILKSNSETRYSISYVPYMVPEVTKSLVNYICSVSIDMQNDFNVIEADRAARLEIINKLTQELEVSEADRKAQLQALDDMNKTLAVIEADRAARLEIINKLTKELEVSEADRAARLIMIDEYSKHDIRSLDLLRIIKYIIYRRF